MQWDLSYLFATYEDFLKSLESLDGYVEKLAGYKGKLKDEEAFVSFLELSTEFDYIGGKTYQYASLKSDLNKKDVKALTDLNRCQMVFFKLSEALSFQDPEIKSLGKEYVMNVLNKHDSVKQYIFPMTKLFDSFDHVLDDNSERLLSYYGPLSEAGSELYSTLAVGDSKSGVATLCDGSKVTVTQGSYRLLIEQAKCEEDRDIIFNTLYQTYEDHKNTFATIYKTVLDADKAYAKARNYESSLEAHLSRNNIPTSVYKNLVSVASNNNDSLKRYFKLKAKALGLSKYHTYDRFLQLSSSDKTYTYDEGKEMFFKSIERFNDSFIQKAHDVLKDGFVDVYEKEGKRTGAYSSGMTDLHPYILLNHDGTLDSCFTIAHEAGHSIHSMYAMEAQPNILQNYTIFVAEIASTFNEHNLLDYIIKSGKASKEEKIMVIQKAIDSIASTFYRQTLFAEYEYIAHTKNEEGEAINHEVLSSIMHDLYLKYYDVDIYEEGLKKYVWAYIPHLFYTPYYVYQYATSFAASFKLYKDVNEGVPHAFDKYINLLKAGGSKYPTEEAKEAGVDFTNTDAFMAVVERLDYLVDELEKLLNE